MLVALEGEIKFVLWTVVVALCLAADVAVSVHAQFDIASHRLSLVRLPFKAERPVFEYHSSVGTRNWSDLKCI